ncbi:hypothetical protein Y695_04410 [Hydrogenophaga sp. T4]|nr:hypothetical protein Y695_04410 [Hydrogenophaga sp. T4]
MSTASMSMRASIATRMSLVQGSAPKMPMRRLLSRGSRPRRSNSSAMASM